VGKRHDRLATDGVPQTIVIRAPFDSFLKVAAPAGGGRGRRLCPGV